MVNNSDNSQPDGVSGGYIPPSAVLPPPPAVDSLEKIIERFAQRIRNDPDFLEKILMDIGVEHSAQNVVWRIEDIRPKVLLMSEFGNTFIIIEIRDEFGESIGWLLFNQLKGEAYMPCDGYWTTRGLVDYLNKNKYEKLEGA